MRGLLSGGQIQSLPLHLPDAFEAIARARTASRDIAPAAYEKVMQECIATGRPVAVYRLMEEAAADGVRLSQFSSRAMFDGLLPPEAEDLRSSSGPSEVQLSADATPKLFSDALPQLWAKPCGSVQAFDCTDHANNDEALSTAWATASMANAPVLFRGVGATWPAARAFSLPELARSLQRGMVRVSPSSRVTFCRESHPEVRSGAFEPPSRTVIMDVREFIDRLHVRRGGRPPMLYGEEERCYLQALAPYSMMRQLDFSFLPSAPPQAAAPRGLFGRIGRRQPAAPPPLGRLWVSAPGTISPLHYDETECMLAPVMRPWARAPLRVAGCSP